MNKEAFSVVDTLKMALEALKDNQQLVADNERYAYAMEYNSIIEKCEEALAQPAVTESHKQDEQLLQEWLPRLWDALRDVRNNENASAEETLYELYVEMKHQTIAEKIDTFSEITLKDKMSVLASELLTVQKRVSELEQILGLWSNDHDRVSFARAIEAAHGITASEAKDSAKE